MLVKPLVFIMIISSAMINALDAQNLQFGPLGVNMIEMGKGLNPLIIQCLKEIDTSSTTGYIVSVSRAGRAPEEWSYKELEIEKLNTSALGPVNHIFLGLKNGEVRRIVIYYPDGKVYQLKKELEKYFNKPQIEIATTLNSETPWSSSEYSSFYWSTEAGFEVVLSAIGSLIEFRYLCDYPRFQ